MDTIKSKNVNFRYSKGITETRNTNPNFRKFLDTELRNVDKKANPHMVSIADPFCIPIELPTNAIPVLIYGTEHRHTTVWLIVEQTATDTEKETISVLFPSEYEYRPDLDAIKKTIKEKFDFEIELHEIEIFKKGYLFKRAGTKDFLFLEVNAKTIEVFIFKNTAKKIEFSFLQNSWSFSLSRFTITELKNLVNSLVLGCFFVS